jgi:heavy metal sensor kinase
VRDRMAQPLDHQLRADLEEIRQRLEVSPDGRLRWNGRDLSDRAAWMTDYPWFELWDEDRQLVRRLWPFAENRVQDVPHAPVPGRETLSVFSVAPDLRLRVLSVPYPIPGHDEPWMLRIMRIHEPIGDAMGALRWIIFVALPASAVLLALAGYSVTRRWLMPLRRMAESASRITADNLGHRLPIENPADETGQLGQKFNLTLDRLEASFNALDRFVADASHELRTPLTTLRSVGEVGLRRGRSLEEYREIIGSMLEEAERLEQLIGRLLELATAEAGATDVHRTELRVDDYIRESMADFEILAEARGQRIVIHTVPCEAHTDPVLLRQALQNLVENAVKFSPAGSTLDVGLLCTAERIEITVADEGPGVDLTAAAHLSDRFFRVDRGRGREAGGFGLGLSLTKAYMRLLGGELGYERRSPAGSRFRLTLPRRRDAVSGTATRNDGDGSA